MGELPGNYHIKDLVQGVKTERKEISDRDARYLAGIFEMGGGMSMRPKNSSRYPATKWPLDMCVVSKVYFNDNNQDALLDLKGMFGGDVVKVKDKNSWRWIAQDLQATEILERIRPYAPFRSPQIDAFSRLWDGITIDKQLELAEAFTQHLHGLKDYPDVEAYRDLVKDPDFLRGVYAARGAQYRYKTDEILRFNSQNISLMTALGQEFGLEPIPVVGMQTQREPQDVVPVSFVIDIRNSTKEHFLERIALPVT